MFKYLYMVTILFITGVVFSSDEGSSARESSYSGSGLVSSTGSYVCEDVYAVVQDRYNNSYCYSCFYNKGRLGWCVQSNDQLLVEQKELKSRISTLEKDKKNLEATVLKLNQEKESLEKVTCGGFCVGMIVFGVKYYYCL